MKNILISINFDRGDIYETMKIICSKCKQNKNKLCECFYTKNKEPVCSMCAQVDDISNLNIKFIENKDCTSIYNEETLKIEYLNCTYTYVNGNECVRKHFKKTQGYVFLVFLAGIKYTKINTRVKIPKPVLNIIWEYFIKYTQN